MSQFGTKIWHENHDLCILSGVSRKVRIFDTVGQLVKIVEVEGGTLCRIQDLTPGIYIVDQTKVIIH